MTRKDYILIAEAIKQARTTVRAHPTTLVFPDQGIGITVSYIAEALADDNPSFDAERFIAACELPT